MNADRRDTCVHSGLMRPTNIPHIKIHVDQMLELTDSTYLLILEELKMHTETVKKKRKKEEIS